MLRLLLERLNTPQAVGIALLAVLAINGLLFYLSKQRLAGSAATTLLVITVDLVAAVQGSADSLQEPASTVQQAQSMTALVLLITLVTLAVVNIVSAVVAIFTLRSVRKSIGLSENRIRYLPVQSYPMAFLPEERQPLTEARHSLETEQQIDKLRQQIQSLQQEYEQLAEELERMQARYQESHRERERIVQGLQHIQKVLEERAASPR